MNKQLKEITQQYAHRTLLQNTIMGLEADKNSDKLKINSRVQK